MLLVAGLLSVGTPVVDWESVRQAFLEGQRPWQVADYVADTTTDMVLFAPTESPPLTLRWRVHRVSDVQRREASWVVNLTDVTEQEDSERLRRYGFGLIDQFVWYTGRDDEMSVGAGSDKGRSRNWSVAARGGTAIFDGIVPSNGAQVAELLALAGPVTVVEDRDTVAGHRTLLVQAHKTGLSVRLWVAPDAGHQLVRLELLMDAGPEHAALFPSAAGTPATVDQPVLQYDVIVKEVEIDSIHGHPLITRAVTTERWVYGNGAIVTYVHNASRREIDLSPAPLDGRMALDIPDGTLIFPETPDGPLFRWRDNRLVLTIDALLSRVVESAIGDIVESLASRGEIDRMEPDLYGGGAPEQPLGRNPYCGIFAFYGAARLLHKAVDLDSLVSPLYVSTPKGSSIQDLLEAAAAHGLHARPLKNLEREDLFTTGQPAILHVRREQGASEFDHFVLFCPTPDRRGAIIDLPRGVYPMEDYDLAGLWNGVAVVMSETPMSGFLWTRRLALVGALLILVLAGRRWSLRSHRPTGDGTGAAGS